MSENAVARQIVDAAYRVHTTLGPGLLESVYEAALAYELEKRGLRITRQQAIPVIVFFRQACVTWARTP
jgi:GxxExxY protein